MVNGLELSQSIPRRPEVAFGIMRPGAPGAPSTRAVRAVSVQLFFLLWSLFLLRLLIFRVSCVFAV